MNKLEAAAALATLASLHAGNTVSIRCSFRQTSYAAPGRAGQFEKKQRKNKRRKALANRSRKRNRK